MANTLYDKGREKFATAQINWTSDTIRVALVDTGVYTLNASTHEFYSSVSGVVAGPVTLSGCALVSGACDANDVTFSAVSGSSSEALIIYKDTGNAATSPLLVYIDTATGLPITPNGGDIVVTWDNGTNRIFKL